MARTRRGRAGTVWPVDWVSAVLCPVMCPPWHGSRRACSDAPQGDGYYRGAVYHGALQMLQDEGGRLLAGKWVGFGKDGEINDGPWSLTLVDERVDAEAVERWNRVPEVQR